MRIFGIPVELLLITVIVIIVIIIAIIVLVKVIGKTSRKSTSGDRAYQNITQLDDLRKRNAISEDEYQQKKNELLNRM